MNKAELVDSVASSAGVDKKQAENVLRSFFDTVTAEVRRGEKVAWPGFGSFKTSKRAARQGRNPQTGEKVRIKASTVMRFTPSSTLKEALNGRGGTKKAAAKKSTAKKSTAKKATAKKTAAKKTAAKKAPATKAATKKAPAKKTAARKTTAKKATARKR